MAEIVILWKFNRLKKKVKYTRKVLEALKSHSEIKPGAYLTNMEALFRTSGEKHLLTHSDRNARLSSV